MKIVSAVAIPCENGTPEYLLTAAQWEIDLLAQLAGQPKIDVDHAKDTEINLQPMRSAH